MKTSSPYITGMTFPLTRLTRMPLPMAFLIASMAATSILLSLCVIVPSTSERMSLITALDRLVH